MSASTKIQDAVRDVLLMPDRLRAAVTTISRKTKSLEGDLDAAASNDGLCLWVMPPLPLSALQGSEDVFFDRSEIRVRIVEKTAVNLTVDGDDQPVTAYELIEDVANALQWQPHKDLQAAVAARMTSASEDEPTASAWVAAQSQFAPLVALGNILTAHPMYLAPRPVEVVEDPKTRLFDVIFEAPYGFQPAS